MAGRGLKRLGIEGLRRGDLWCRSGAAALLASWLTGGHKAAARDGVFSLLSLHLWVYDGMPSLLKMGFRDSRGSGQ